MRRPLAPVLGGDDECMLKWNRLWKLKDWLATQQDGEAQLQEILPAQKYIKLMVHQRTGKRDMDEVGKKPCQRLQHMN